MDMKRQTIRLTMHLGCLLIAIVIALVLFTVSIFFKPFKNLEENFVNLRFKILKNNKVVTTMADNTELVGYSKNIQDARKDIRIIGIKTKTLEKLDETWPIHWSIYAEIINGFKGTKNLLIFDIFFVDYKPLQKDAMEAALKGTNNVMFDYSIESTAESRSSVINLDSRIEKLRRFKLKNVKDEDDQGVSWLSFTVPPIEQVTENSAGVGFANIRKEENSSNRHMPLVAKVYNHGPNNETEFYPSIDLIATTRFLGVDVVEDTEVVMGKYVKIKNIPKKMIKDKNGEHDIMTVPNKEREIVIPIDIYGQMEINFVGSLFCFRDDDLYDVAELGKEYSTQYSDTIFLVAMYYATGRGASKDTHLSPYGEMSGIEHHAHAINTILNQKFLERSQYLNFLIFIVVGLTLGYLQPRVNIFLGFVIFLSILLSYIGIAFYLFASYLYVIPLSFIIVELVMIFVSIHTVSVFTED
jgi:adenylate cyclase